MNHPDEQIIHAALGHPEDRDGPANARDRISLRDHVVDVEIGAFQQERGRTQRLRFNLVVDLLPADPVPADDVDRILSYDVLSDAVSRELAHERLNLLETLADRIAARVLREPQAQQIILRIEKLDRGSGALGVEILRRKQDVALPEPARIAPEVVPERVIWLAPCALKSAHLPGALTRWAAQTPGLILCVSGPQQTPETDVAEAQLRINLLAAEQSAWLLAALCPQCSVVSSRTEIDWAVKSGKPAIWAPSKLVLDSFQQVPPDMAKTAELGGWLAQYLGAENLLIVGDDLSKTKPKIGGVAVKRLELAGLSGT